MLLSKLCETAGVGQPFYEVQYSHAGPDGFLYFSYKVQILGITATFKGLVMILPGPNASTMLEEAQKAVAQQVLQKMYNTGLTPWTADAVLQFCFTSFVLCAFFFCMFLLE